MITFLFGADSFRVREKLRELEAAFARHDKNNLNRTVLEGEKCTAAGLRKAASTLPFLGDRRLVVVLDVLHDAKKKEQEQILAYLKEDAVPKTTDILFAEHGMPDRRSALFQFLSKRGNVTLFSELEGAALAKWIQDRVRKGNAKIAPTATTKLIAFVGSDLWQMEGEIEKLIAYTEGNITPADVDLLVHAKLDANIFDFTDAIGRKDRARAAQLLHDQLATGTHPLVILSMLARQVRNLTLLADMSAREKSPVTIQRETGLHPFVIKKTLPQARNFTSDRLKFMYRKLMELDVSMKTSRMEPILGLDLLVVEFCRA